MNKQMGLITEQGDLGFGFNPMDNKDQQVYNEATKRHEQEQKNQTILNETNRSKNN